MSKFTRDFSKFLLPKGSFPLGFLKLQHSTTICLIFPGQHPSINNILEFFPQKSLCWITPASTVLLCFTWLSTSKKSFLMEIWRALNGTLANLDIYIDGYRWNSGMKQQQNRNPTVVPQISSFVNLFPPPMLLSYILDISIIIIQYIYIYISHFPS